MYIYIYIYTIYIYILILRGFVARFPHSITGAESSFSLLIQELSRTLIFLETIFLTDAGRILLCAPYYLI